MNWMEKTFRTDGKIAMITGGAGGIGFACAKALAYAGADLILVDKNQQALESAGAKLSEGGFRCMTAVCDVSDRNSVKQVMEQARPAARWPQPGALLEPGLLWTGAAIGILDA